MSWTQWFCPPEPQEEDPRLRKLREDEEERARLSQSGHVPITGEYWKISEDGQREKCELALKKGKRTDARYIEVKLRMPGFFKQVEHVQFTQLRSLYLGGCGIVSLESVVRLKMPNLTNLDLRHNSIAEIRSLRKMACRFDHLFLSGNPIVDFSALPAIHFHQRLKTTFVTNFAGESYAVIHDLGPFFKSEARYVLDHLYIHQISTLAGETRKHALLEK